MAQCMLQVAIVVHKVFRFSVRSIPFSLVCPPSKKDNGQKATLEAHVTVPTSIFYIQSMFKNCVLYSCTYQLCFPLQYVQYKWRRPGHDQTALLYVLCVFVYCYIIRMKKCGSGNKEINQVRLTLTSISNSRKPMIMITMAISKQLL